MSTENEKISFFGKIKNFFSKFYKSFCQILAAAGAGILVYLSIRTFKNAQENYDNKKKEKLTEDITELKDKLDDVKDKVEEAKETATAIDETVKENKNKVEEKVEEYVSEQEENLENAGFIKDK